MDQTTFNKLMDGWSTTDAAARYRDGLLARTLGASGPNVGQDLERTESLEATLATVRTDVADIKAKLEEPPAA